MNYLFTIDKLKKENKHILKFENNDFSSFFTKIFIQYSLHIFYSHKYMKNAQNQSRNK